MIAEQGNKHDVFHRQMETATLVTGRLAHDFSNILTGILGFAELSLSQLNSDSPARCYVEEIVNAAQNGAGWIRKLQDFSRPINPRIQSIHLAPLVGSEEDRLRQAWGNRVTLLVAMPEDLPPVAMDADAVRQLLGQLLDNAGEAVADRGVVALSGRTVELGEEACQNLIGSAQSGKHVEITITDSGTGLSEEARQRLSFLESCDDGFQIAEKDLELRGPGDLLGLRQSGLPEFVVADPFRDLAHLRTAREEARRRRAAGEAIRSDLFPLPGRLSEATG